MKQLLNWLFMHRWTLGAIFVFFVLLFLIGYSEPALWTAVIGKAIWPWSLTMGWRSGLLTLSLYLSLILTIYYFCGPGPLKEIEPTQKPGFAKKRSPLKRRLWGWFFVWWGCASMIIPWAWETGWQVTFETILRTLFSISLIGLGIWFNSNLDLVDGKSAKSITREMNLLGRAFWFGFIIMVTGLIWWAGPVWYKKLTLPYHVQASDQLFKDLPNNYFPFWAVLISALFLGLFFRTWDELSQSDWEILKYLSEAGSRHLLTILATGLGIGVLIFVPQISHVFFQLPCPVPIITDWPELLTVWGFYLFLFVTLFVLIEFLLVMVPPESSQAGIAQNNGTPQSPEPDPAPDAPPLNAWDRAWHGFMEIPIQVLSRFWPFLLIVIAGVFLVMGGCFLYSVLFFGAEFERKQNGFWELGVRTTIFLWAWGISGWVFWLVFKIQRGQQPRVTYAMNITGRALWIWFILITVGELIWWLPGSTHNLVSTRNYTIFGVLTVLFLLIATSRVLDGLHYHSPPLPWRVIGLIGLVIGVALMRPEQVGESLDPAVDSKKKLDPGPAQALVNESLEEHWFKYFEDRLKALDSLKESFPKSYVSPYSPNGVSLDGPVILLAASGGGSRAALFTALVLSQLDQLAPNGTALDPPSSGPAMADHGKHLAPDGSGSDPVYKKLPTLADHVLVISSVSGGSLGSAYYAFCQSRGRSVNEPINSLEHTFEKQLLGNMVVESEEAWDWAKQQYDNDKSKLKDYEQVVRDLKNKTTRNNEILHFLRNRYFDDMSTDFMAPLVRGILLPGVERGQRLSQFWEQNFGWQEINNQDGFCGPHHAKEAQTHLHVPLLLLNATEVRNGRRLVMGFPALPPGLLKIQPRPGPGPTVRGANEKPIELVDLNPYWKISLADAVRLSANFPWGLEVATNPSLKMPLPFQETEARLLDGGLVDNTGIDTLASLFFSLNELARRAQNEVAWGVAALGATPFPGPGVPFYPTITQGMALGSIWPIPGEELLDIQAPELKTKLKTQWRAWKLIKRLQNRNVVLIEIDSGAKPGDPTNLARVFPSLFLPVGAMNNAQYGTANLTKDHYLQGINSFWSPGDHFFRVIFQCNHTEHLAQHVMTAFALGPRDKAKIFIQFLLEKKIQVPNLQTCLKKWQEKQEKQSRIQEVTQELSTNPDNEAARQIYYQLNDDIKQVIAGIANLQVESTRKAQEKRVLFSQTLLGNEKNVAPSGKDD